MTEENMNVQESVSLGAIASQSKKNKNIAVLSFMVLAGVILFYYLLTQIPFIWGIIKAILSVLAPLIIGFVLAFVLNPAVMFFEGKFMKFRNAHKAFFEKRSKKRYIFFNKKEGAETCDDNADITNQNMVLQDGRKTARRLSIVITVTIFLAIVTLLMISVIPSFTRSVSKIAEKVPEYTDKVNHMITDVINNHDWIKKQVSDTDELLEKFDVSGLLNKFVSGVLSKATDFVAKALKLVFNIVIGLVIAVYLLGGKERYIGQLKKASFAVMKPRKAKSFVQNMHKVNIVFKSAILGKILDSIIIGCLCFIGTTILGLCGFQALADNNLLISMVVGVTNVIPFFGPYIGAIPCIFLTVCESPVDGVAFTIFIIVLQQFDCNFLDPRVVGKSVGLSPLYVLSSCLICGGLFGVVGLLIASPTGALIYGIVKTSFESKLEAKNLPIDTFEYATKPGLELFNSSIEEETTADAPAEATTESSEEEK